MTKGFILTFHSQNVAGCAYAQTDDHVALDEALRVAAQLSIPVLPLLGVVRRLRSGSGDLPARFACITFDDGTDYDWKPIAATAGALHEPMAAILRRHGRRGLARLWRRKLSATSFVIASPQAREEIMAPLAPVRMSEDWWAEAQRSGLIDIGVHGWDHVHPSVAAVRAQPELVERFDRIASAEQAQVQVDQAAQYIAARAGEGAAQLFAYPYGQVSDYLADTYFPAQQRILAAFTTEGVALEPGMDPWRLPRMVSGWHWNSGDELRSLLQG